jgi:hypothetical protein
MATYYVRSDGNNSNTGSGLYAGHAWQTLTKALGATGIASGDTVYIAPGSYNESVTIGMTSATATTFVIGDPTAAQFTGITAGPVLWTIYTSVGASPTLTSIIATSKNFLSFQNIVFDGGTVAFTTSRNLSFSKCQFTGTSLTAGNMLTITSPTSTAMSLTVASCSFIGGFTHIALTGQNVSDSTSISDCLFLGARQDQVNITNIQTSFINNTHMVTGLSAGVYNTGGSVSFPSTVTNSLFYNLIFAIYSNTANVLTQSFNRVIACFTSLTNVATSVTTTSTFNHGLILPYYLQNGLGTFQMFSSIFNGPNTAAGTTTGAPAADMYGVTWTGATPDAGSATYRNISTVTT